MVVIYGNLERFHDKVFKFHMNNSSFFVKQASPSFARATLSLMLPLKASTSNKPHRFLLKEIWYL